MTERLATDGFGVFSLSKRQRLHPSSAKWVAFNLVIGALAIPGQKDRDEGRNQRHRAGGEGKVAIRATDVGRSSGHFVRSLWERHICLLMAR